MKQLTIIGNWKSNKTLSEAKEWFGKISTYKEQFLGKTDQTVILCPSFTLLQACRDLIQTYQLPWLVGAQDVSPFSEGKYTGAVNAKQIKDLAQYVLIGHSERRQHFGETDEILAEKVKRAQEVGLKICYLLQNAQTPIPDGVEEVAYEPVNAIGNGNPDTPDDVAKVSTLIGQRFSGNILYGGSAASDNIASFVSLPTISGILSGTASLDAQAFAQLLINA